MDECMTPIEDPFGPTEELTDYERACRIQRMIDAGVDFGETIYD